MRAWSYKLTKNQVELSLEKMREAPFFTRELQMFLENLGVPRFLDIEKNGVSITRKISAKLAERLILHLDIQKAIIKKMDGRWYWEAPDNFDPHIKS